MKMLKLPTWIAAVYTILAIVLIAFFVSGLQQGNNEINSQTLMLGYAYFAIVTITQIYYGFFRKKP